MTPTTSANQSIRLLCTRLRALQNPDGGFRAYHCYDRLSGLWVTAEIVHLVFKTQRPGDDDRWLALGADYLLQGQNEDGGWGFRSGGKSITDVTAWACLALSHFDETDAIRRGVDFILRSRRNSGSVCEGGWGLTTYEPDRVYSTWIASYCLARLLRTNPDLWDASELATIGAALDEAREWLIGVRNPDGGWGALKGDPSSITSTSVALFTIFIQGGNPAEYASACEFIMGAARTGLWPLEREVVVTQEGYELAQEWFSTALAFRALIFFAEMSVCELAVVDSAYNSLQELICPDGNVLPSREAQPDLVWTIPYMVEALDKFRAFAASKSTEYAAFLEARQRIEIRHKRERLEKLLLQSFPYPVSHVFVQYQHEMDWHRRFHLMLQLFEVTLKYATIVVLSGYFAGHEVDATTNQILADRFRRPSLGDWARLLNHLLKGSAGVERLLAPLPLQEVWGKRKSYLSGNDAANNLVQDTEHFVSLRNRLTGHGAVRSLYEYKLLVEEQVPRLYAFLDRMSFLAHFNSFFVLATEYDEFGDGDRYKVRIFNGLEIADDDLETARRLSEGQRDRMIRYLYFHNTETSAIANLYPFLSYMVCPECRCEHFFFFNSRRSPDLVEYLSFECGHTITCDNTAHFEKRLASVDIRWNASSESQPTADASV